MPDIGCKSTIAIGNRQTPEVHGSYRRLQLQSTLGTFGQNWEDLRGIAGGQKGQHVERKESRIFQS